MWCAYFVFGCVRFDGECPKFVQVYRFTVQQVEAETDAYSVSLLKNSLVY